jgi:hypothetical protein
MPTTTTILTGLAGVFAVLALAVYLFGIPPEMKRKMEKAALKTMGENKASYMMKGRSPLLFKGDTFVNLTELQQIKSLRSQPPTKKTSKTSRAPWAVSAVGQFKILSARKVESWRIRSPVPSLVGRKR